MQLESRTPVHVGGHVTVGTPVVEGDWLYFRGDDNKLWRVMLDESRSEHIGGHHTRSTPTVHGGYVYFRGTDERIWKVRVDGGESRNFGGHRTRSAPFVDGRYVYFQGTDDKLWRVNLDGSNGTNLGGHRTSSPPFAEGGFVYFRGTDNTLWRVRDDGTDTRHLGHTTASAPHVAGGAVYFQGADSKLWRVSGDGSETTRLGGHWAGSTPFVYGEYVYFQGTNDKLWKVLRGDETLQPSPGGVAVADAQDASISDPIGSFTFRVKRALDIGLSACLDLSGGSSLNGTNVQLWSCVGAGHPDAKNQTWTTRDLGNGYYQIVSDRSGKCLDLSDGGTSNGTNVKTWACLSPGHPDLPNQLWAVRDVGGDYRQVISKKSGKCLDIDGGRTTNGTNVQTWTCVTNVDRANQTWRLSAG